MDQLQQKAEEVLKRNDRGSYTVPSLKLYPHQWAWDSAFAAIGWAHIDVDRGLCELETLLDGQWEDGRIPHIQFDPETSGYFPGPENWGCTSSSTITQPPVSAIALKILLENGADPDRIRSLLPKIEQSHLFFYRERDPLALGIIAVAHPWESGMDNSPAWDQSMKRIDPGEAPDFQRIDNTVVKDKSQRPSDDEYKRYMVIVDQIAKNGFGLGSFAVYDPMMSTVLALAENALADLGERLNAATDAKKRAEQLVDDILKQLWDSDVGRFRYYDAMSETRYTPDVIGAYFPMLLKIPGEVKKCLGSRLSRNYTTAWMLPSVPPRNHTYNNVCYWRGPVWINVNWFFADHFGDGFRRKTLDLLNRGGFREYFHPETGEGLGAEDFTWSAALALDLLASVTNEEVSI